MPRTSKVSPTTHLIHRRDACKALACSKNTFWRKWHAVFTDPRPEHERRPCFERRVYADELEIAVEQSSQCPAAVLNFRHAKKRL